MPKEQACVDCFDMFKRSLTSVFLVLSFYYSFFYFPPYIFSSILVSALAFIAFLEWPGFFPKNKLLGWALFPLYPSLPLLCIIALNQTVPLRNLIVTVGIIVYSFDFGSYLAGTLIGRNKLAPTISPKKTWEGVYGGVLSAVLATYLICRSNQTGAGMVTILATALFIAALALCGDLFESFLKRRANLKDSGRVLPGHGGLLDRLDSLMFIMPIAYFLRVFFADILLS